jgi:hypothetical protein
MEPHINKPDPSFGDQYPPMDKPIDPEAPSLSSSRRSESAEKYFNWIRKTQRK